MGKTIKKHKKPKEYLVLSTNISSYKLIDIRTNRPIGVRDTDGEMLLQQIENIELSSKPIKYPNTFEYFTPNNVGLLLSKMEKSIAKAKEIYLTHINPDKFNHSQLLKDANNKTEYLTQNSMILYEFIEEIQTAIVFGYTAIEAFTNLSIPKDYIYVVEKSNKGIQEIYDKTAIERWLNLTTKVEKILVDIYKDTTLIKSPIWSKFKRFEKMRHDIIHQKSVLETELYAEYLKKSIFDTCLVPTKLIQHFYENLQRENKTNPVWPWITGVENMIPIDSKFKGDNFELSGNIYEGRKK